MASNLSTLGFSFNDEGAFRESMLRLAANATGRLDCAVGAYSVWRSRTGAEIWFHLAAPANGETEIRGLTPFFDGESDVAVRIAKLQQRDGDTAFEGCATAWINATEANDADYPIVFDVVDFAAATGRNVLALQRMRLVAFARKVEAFYDQAHYLAARADASPDEPTLAAQVFIPLVLFADPADPARRSAADAGPVASSSAMFTGRIIEWRELTNEATGCVFVWALVETFGATLDVVADPDIIAGALRQDGTIAVTGWLFGRILD